MANDDVNRGPGRVIGQGSRDSDPQLARERRGGGGVGMPRRTDMPDFVCGPGYTGQIPPEGEHSGQPDWHAGGDIGRGAEP
jgi:hypothetical protein